MHCEKTKINKDLLCSVAINSANFFLAEKKILIFITYLTHSIEFFIFCQKNKYIAYVSCIMYPHMSNRKKDVVKAIQYT